MDFGLSEERRILRDAHGLALVRTPGPSQSAAQRRSRRHPGIREHGTNQPGDRPDFRHADEGRRSGVTVSVITRSASAVLPVVSVM